MDEQDNAPRSPAEEQARIVEQMKKLQREFMAASEAKFYADVEDVRRENPEQADALMKLHALSHARQLGREALMSIQSVGQKFEPADILRSMRMSSIIAKPVIDEERQKIVQMQSRINAGELDIQDAMEQAEQMVQVDMQRAVQSVCETLELRPIPDTPTVEGIRNGTVTIHDVLPPSWNTKQKDWFSLVLIFVSAFMADKHAPEMPEDDMMLPAGTVDRPEHRT